MLRPFTWRAVWFIASRPLFLRQEFTCPVSKALAFEPCCLTPWSLGGALDLDLSEAGPGDDRKSPGNLEMLMRYENLFGGTLGDSYGMWEIMG